MDTLIIGGTLVGSLGVALAAAGTFLTVVFKLMGAAALQPQRIDADR